MKKNLFFILSFLLLAFSISTRVFAKNGITENAFVDSNAALIKNKITNTQFAGNGDPNCYYQIRSQYPVASPVTVESKFYLYGLPGEREIVTLTMTICTGETISPRTLDCSLPIGDGIHWTSSISVTILTKEDHMYTYSW